MLILYTVCYSSLALNQQLTILFIVLPLKLKCIDEVSWTNIPQWVNEYNEYFKGVLSFLTFTRNSSHKQLNFLYENVMYSVKLLKTTVWVIKNKIYEVNIVFSST